MLSLIEFESYKPETNQKNVSPFEMHSSFEYKRISVHLPVKDVQALSIRTLLGQQVGVEWMRSCLSAPSQYVSYTLYLYFE